MSDNAAYVLAASIIIAGLLSGGFYAVEPGSNGAIIKMNRFLGTVSICHQWGGCE